MKIIIAAVVPLALVACSPLAPLPTTLECEGYADASNPISPAPSGPTVDYAGYRVSEPADWQGMNDAQLEK